MKFWKIVLTTVLVAVLAGSVCAKDKDKGSVVQKAGKITEAAETVAIVPALEIVDPYRPKAEHKGNDFALTFYSEKSRSWDASGEVKRIPAVGGPTQRLRFQVDEPGVSVALERLNYYDGVQWFRPVETIFEIEAAEGQMYEFKAPLADKIHKYRLLARKANRVVRVPLLKEQFRDLPERVWESGDIIRYHLDEYEPMANMLRVYAYWTAVKHEDVRTVRPLYWRTLATAWSMVMGQAAPLDSDGYYHSTEWFFDEFAYALFKDVNWPDLVREDHVLWFAERPEPYVIRRRTFDINLVDFVSERVEGERLVVKMYVRCDRGNRFVELYLSPANLYKHPFAWKVDYAKILSQEG